MKLILSLTLMLGASSAAWAALGDTEKPLPQFTEEDTAPANSNATTAQVVTASSPCVRCQGVQTGMLTKSNQPDPRPNDVLGSATPARDNSAPDVQKEKGG
jgi:hypothetical protein